MGQAFHPFVPGAVVLEGLYRRCLGLFVTGLAALFEVADCGIAPVVGYQHLEIVACLVSSRSVVAFVPPIV